MNDQTSAKTIQLRSIALVVGTLLMGGTALANPPHPNVYNGGNLWEITAYDDSSSNHHTVRANYICFLPYSIVGTSIQGRWYSPSFRDWNGRYYQEGDELKMTGDFEGDYGHDHMTLQLTTEEGNPDVGGMAFKDWTQWFEDGDYGEVMVWGNSQMVRIPRLLSWMKCRSHLIDELSSDQIESIEAEALELSRSLPERLTISGEIAEAPTQPDLETLDEYLERTGGQ